MNEEKSIIDLAQGRTPQAPSEPTNIAEQEAMRPNQRRDTPGDKSKEFASIMDGLLENVQDSTGWMEIELPSRCAASIRPFNYEDERILRSVGKTTSDAKKMLKNLMSRCVKGIEIDDLHAGDFTYILFKLRELSYGNEYQITITCEKCGGENELRVELDKLKVNYAEEGWSKPVEVMLPDSQKRVTLRKPLVRDVEKLEDLSNMTENLWRFVTEIEGHSDRMIIQTFITKTTVKDIATIRETLLRDDVGLDTSVRYVCKGCNLDTSVELPMTADFFTVS